MDLVFYYNASWRDLPLTEHENNGRRGVALTIPPPNGSDLAGPLVIEETGPEVTIRFDYGHISLNPPWRTFLNGKLNLNLFGVLDGILKEEIICISFWSDGKLGVAAFCEAGETIGPDTPLYKRIRYRSWNGTFDRDQVQNAGS